MAGMTGSETLRAQLATGQPVLMPGVWDPLSALIAAEAGFEVAFLSGYAVAGSYLGMPDVGLLTQTEVVDVARRVHAAVPGLALVVDADTGYGNPINTIRTVQLWEQAGAAAMFLEDQVFPKKCGHMAGKQVVPKEEWLAKLRAALDHRTSLFVTGRTDARAMIGLDEAIERARMARDFGADALFVEAPQSIAEMEQIAAALPGCTLVANMVEAGMTPLLTPHELGQLGFSLIVSPVTGLFSAVKLNGTNRCSTAPVKCCESRSACACTSGSSGTGSAVLGALAHSEEGGVQRTEHGLRLEQLLLVAGEANPAAQEGLLRAELVSGDRHRCFPVLLHPHILRIGRAGAEGGRAVADLQVVDDHALGAVADHLRDPDRVLVDEFVKSAGGSDLVRQGVDPFEAEIANHWHSLPDRATLSTICRQ